MKPMYLALRTYLDFTNADAGLPRAMLLRLDEALLRALEVEVTKAQDVPDRPLMLKLPATAYTWLSTVGVQEQESIDFGEASRIVAPRALASVPGFFDAEADVLIYAGSQAALTLAADAAQLDAPCEEFSHEEIEPARLEILGRRSLTTGHVEVGIHFEATMGEQRVFSYGTTWSTIHPELNRHLNGARLDARAPLFPSAPVSADRSLAVLAAQIMQAVASSDLVHPVDDQIAHEDVIDWAQEFASGDRTVSLNEFAHMKAMCGGWTTREARATATTPAPQMEWERKLAVARQIMAIPAHVPRSSAHQAFMDPVYMEAAERALHVVGMGGWAEAHHLAVSRDGKYQKLTYDGIPVASVLVPGEATAKDWISALRSNLDLVPAAGHSVSIRAGGRQMLRTSDELHIQVHNSKLTLVDDQGAAHSLSMSLRFSQEGMTRDLLGPRGDLVATEVEAYDDTVARLGDAPLDEEVSRNAPRN